MATLIVIEELAGPVVLGRGGHVMHILQWLHGLERLGHRVLFVEFLEGDSQGARESIVDYFREIVETWWRPSSAALILRSSCESLYGLDADGVARIAGDAAAVITLMATYHRHPHPLVEHIRPRILIETDPAYTHLWAGHGNPADIYGEHDIYYTVGGNIGSPKCSVPTLGIQWRHLWNPVVLDWWPPGRQIIRNRFTTVADWRGYGYLEFEGQILGPKAEEFRKVIELPALIGQAIEIALDIDQDDPDISYLQNNGWKIESPKVVRNPAMFRDFVAGSLGEFSCAKGGYVGTRCGWFSDRSACYLAAGRPVVLQATGFEDLLPTGKGLFSVTGVEEAAEAIKSIERDYRVHSAAARAIAQEYLDSNKILRCMLATAGI